MTLPSAPFTSASGGGASHPANTRPKPSGRSSPTPHRPSTSGRRASPHRPGRYQQVLNASAAQPRHHRAGHRAARGGQRIEYPLAKRLDRIERLSDIGEQDLRVVVPLVQRHPRERLAVALGPLRQQRRLPVPGRRDHRDHRERPALPEPVNQGQPAHAAGPDHGMAQLRRSELGRKPIRSVP